MDSTRSVGPEGHSSTSVTSHASGSADGSALKKVKNFEYHMELLNQKTDYSRWRLLDQQGRHTWHYLTTDEQMKAWPQTTADKYCLGLPSVSFPRCEVFSWLTLLGCPRSSTLYTTVRSDRQCFVVLLATSAPTRRLGMRVQWTTFTAARLGHLLVCYKYTNTA